MTRRNIPAPVRREVAVREGVVPGETTILTCAYCPATTAATWPLNQNGTPSYWPMFGRGFGLDHVIPVARGGAHEAANLVVACGKCNTAKRDRPAEEFRTRSAGPPQVLRTSSTGPHVGPVSGREGKGRDRNGRDVVPIHSYVRRPVVGEWMTANAVLGGVR